MSLEFMIEIGCEEIPARYIDSTLSQLRENLAKKLSMITRLGTEPYTVTQHPADWFWSYPHLKSAKRIARNW